MNLKQNRACFICKKIIEKYWQPRINKIRKKYICYNDNCYNELKKFVLENRNIKKNIPKTNIKNNIKKNIPKTNIKNNIKKNIKTNIKKNISKTNINLIFKNLKKKKGNIFFSGIYLENIKWIEQQSKNNNISKAKLLNRLIKIVKKDI